MRTFRIALAAIACIALTAPLMAHHGTAAYETTQTQNVKGTVTDFQFINPHVLIFFDVKNETGQIEKWQGELTSPNRLSRSGWTKHTMKPGDELTFSGYRAKNHAPTLWITKIVAADGHEIPLAPGD